MEILSAITARDELYGGFLNDSNTFMPIVHLIPMVASACGTSMHYRGLRCNKHPMDAWAYQEIIYETQPQVIIELGRQDGGSTLWLRDLLETVNDNKGVISVDIGKTIDFDACVNTDGHRIKQFVADSEDPETVKNVSEMAAGFRTMVIDDCSHTNVNVTKNLLNYGPLVTEGCYHIVEDTILNHGLFHEQHWVDGNCPMEAVKAYLENHNDFEVDRSREKWFLTFNPKGSRYTTMISSTIRNDPVKSVSRFLPK